MVRRKSKATIMVADGGGGLAKVQDRRFETGDWPIRFVVPKEQADTWLRYFNAECGRRGWSSSGIGQLEARENSGSITVNSGGPDSPQLAVVWERERDGPINVRARSAGTPEFAVTDAQELFDQTNNRCRSGDTERVYRWGHLHYDNGRAWRGELWLDDRLRLGPPSQQYEEALFGPRVIIVEALVDCAGLSDAKFAFDQILRELSAFLTAIMGTAVQLPEQRKTWTWTVGAADCLVRTLGYFEPESHHQMSAPGVCHSVPLRPVVRPDFSRRGIDGSINEQDAPIDIIDLWTTYRALTKDQRRDFSQAAAKWQEALLHWGERSTLSFALMVVACEALKPSAPKFKDHNVYHVVEALLGKPHAERLRESALRPHDVRNAHFHRGEFRGSEFVHAAITSSYYDPTFIHVRDELALITQAAIVEWLRRGGTFTIPPLRRKRSMRRWVREHALIILPFTMIVGIAAGLILGRVLRAF